MPNSSQLPPPLTTPSLPFELQSVCCLGSFTDPPQSGAINTQPRRASPQLLRIKGVVRVLATPQPSSNLTRQW